MRTVEDMQRLLDLQEKELRKMKEQNTVLHEAAVRALHSATGKCWKECDALLDAGKGK